MKKMQLKNVASMDDYTSGSQNMALSYVDDSGLWNDSGILDESGNLYDVEGGYDYYVVEHPNTVPWFLVRFIIVWSSGNLKQSPAVQVSCGWDDGTIPNPFASGDAPDPVTYINTRNYEVTNVRVTSLGISHLEDGIHVNVTYVIYYDYDQDDITIGNHIIHQHQTGSFHYLINASI